MKNFKVFLYEFCDLRYDRKWLMLGPEKLDRYTTLKNIEFRYNSAWEAPVRQHYLFDEFDLSNLEIVNHGEWI